MINGGGAAVLAADALSLQTPQEVTLAALGMLRRVHELRPDAKVVGFTVQAMVKRPHAHELIVGAATDPIVGPEILFGQGGVAVEVIANRAVALPPLNLALARDLVSHPRVSRLLAGYRDRVAIDHEALHLALLKISPRLCDCPEVVELDINPLLADDRGVIALDARVKVMPASNAGAQRLAIRPYPGELEVRIDFDHRSVLIRPIRPADEPRLMAFFAAAQPQDMRLCFFMSRGAVARSELARFSQIDYEREMTFIAVESQGQGDQLTPDAGMLGEVRVVTDSDHRRAEFAIMVRSDLKGRGLGHLLLAKMICYLRSRGTAVLAGECLRQNGAMSKLARGLGFLVTPSDDGEALLFTLELQPALQPAQLTLLTDEPPVMP